MKNLAGKIKRALAILLAAVMAASALPVDTAMSGASAYAAESESTLPSETEDGSGESTSSEHRGGGYHRNSPSGNF